MEWEVVEGVVRLEDLVVYRLEVVVVSVLGMFQ